MIALAKNADLRSFQTLCLLALFVLLTDINKNYFSLDYKVLAARIILYFSMWKTTKHETILNFSTRTYLTTVRNTQEKPYNTAAAAV